MLPAMALLELAGAAGDLVSPDGSATATAVALGAAFQLKHPGGAALELQTDLRSGNLRIGSCSDAAVQAVHMQCCLRSVQVGSSCEIYQMAAAPCRLRLYGDI